MHSRATPRAAGRGGTPLRDLRVTCLPCRVDPNSGAGDDQQEHRGLSERSQAVGAILSLLLVALTGCLLTLLLYKKERR